MKPYDWPTISMGSGFGERTGFGSRAATPADSLSSNRGISIMGSGAGSSGSEVPSGRCLRITSRSAWNLAVGRPASSSGES